MQGVECFSTMGLKPQHRLQFWNDITNQAFSGTRIRSDDPLFQAEMWRWSLGDLVMLRPRTPQSIVERYTNVPVGERSHIVLHIQHRGRSRVHQCGREAHLETGDLEINFGREHYWLDVMGGNDILSVELPIAPLLDRVPALNERICYSISGRSSAVQLLHGYLLALWQSGQNSDCSGGWRDDAVEAFYSLLAAALRDSGGTEKSTLLQRLKAAVASQLAEPGLGTAMLAMETGLTPRSVQSAFAAIGTTPSAFITDARLERAAEWLKLYPHRSITDIAMSVGFNDSAYFSRCFRSRFGIAAREWRRN